jgi:hypothetical protein
MRWPVVACTVAMACSGGGPGAPKNPPILYMAPLDNELEVQLIDHDPPYY